MQTYRPGPTRARLGMTELTPGSMYEVEDAKVYSVEVYDTLPGDETQFCFWLRLALKEENIGEMIAYQAGAGTTPIEEESFEGYHRWDMQVVMRWENGGWHKLDWGGGGYRLENYR